MQYWQKADKSLDDFIIWARTQVQKSDFTDEELSERLTELIIFSTPYDAFRHDLYSNPKGDNISKCAQRRHKIRSLYNINRLIGLVDRVFADDPGDQGSIPGRVIPKTLKMVLDTFLLNTQHYKVRIKGKVEQSSERSSALLYTLV